MNRIVLFLALGAFGFIACSEKEETDTTNQPTESTYDIGVVETRLGSMYFWLYDETPKHKEMFIDLANQSHYNQFTFNRVVRNFVVQGGCPDSVSYFENSPYLLDPEFRDSIGHIYGALGMGRDDNPDKQSNGCQFYIVCRESGLPQLDSNYMIFGQIVKGTDVLETIESQKVDVNDKPLEDIPLNVYIRKYTEKELLDSLGLQL